MTEVEIQSANIGLRLQVQELEQSVCQWKQRAEEAEALLEEIAKLTEGYTPHEAEKDNLLKPNREDVAYSSRPNRITPAEKAQIRNLYQAGVSINVLCQDYMISKRTIMRYLVQEG